ncbi:alpha/beta hydrolase [Hahella sp. CCB-MM4]|uniref:alpha/beta hydrolase family protein n=1 Tax=Hahella sp. (strain CCB-MM4) TaxID=1926491 RepID=UPI000B9A2784|nr:alpha/beta fold hydrolase [Hahella sp. CCB-MM4]OZG75072.1 alpha/beta hydrolase [Hahella sp. CCB-MM4]
MTTDDLAPEAIEVVADDAVSSIMQLYRAKTPDDSPENNQRISPVILGMPAMGVRSGYYESLARNFQALGMHYACGELRGIGSSSIRASRRTNFGYLDMINRDWPACVEALRLHCPGSPIWLLGHSLGGQLNALYTATHPDQISGMILISSCTVYYRNYPHPIRLWLSSQALRVVAELNGYLPGKRIGFAGTEARRVIRDWARNARNGDYRIENSPLDYDKLLGRIRHPVLGVSLATDDMAPRRAVDHLCQKMEMAKVERWHFENGELTSQLLDHFNWVKHSQELVTRITAWMTSQSVV